MINQIQIAQALGKIKGMERSPCALVESKGEVHPIKRIDLRAYYRDQEMFADVPSVTVKEIGPYLRLAYEDGKWSSASIREGLGLIIYSVKTPLGFRWLLTGDKILPQTEYLKNNGEKLTDPAADELAMQLGIITYHEQFPLEVENYLEGLR